MAIDPGTWFNVWSRLCRRFGRQFSNEEAADYLAYLEARGMTTETALGAAEAVWATREFFPRPADFLAGEATAGWVAILEFAEKWTRHLSGDDARALLAAIPERAKRALDALGGMDVVRNAKDLSRTRRDYFEAFDRALMGESTREALLPPQEVWKISQTASGGVFVDPQPGRVNVRLLKELAGTESVDEARG